MYGKRIMDKSKKILFTIIIDIFLLAIVIIACVTMVTQNIGELACNVLSAVIVLSIPIGFFLTFRNVFWDRFDENESLYDEDDEVHGAGDNGEKEKETEAE